jgi:hypothetical protein
MITIIYESITYTIEENEETDILKTLLKHPIAYDFETLEEVENQKLKCVEVYRNEIKDYENRLWEKNPNLHGHFQCYRIVKYPFIPGEKEPRYF